VFVKAFRSKFYTNNFNEKDLFSARSLFKDTQRSSARSSKLNKKGLKVIKEEVNESFDQEKGRDRESCLTSNEVRFSDMRDTYEQCSYPEEVNIEGERIQNIIRRNHQDRKSNDEPEILSMYSADKSDDLIIQSRKFMKPNFEASREDRINYITEKKRALFGYDDAETNSPIVEISKKKKKSKKAKKVNNEMNNIEIKFGFSENESDAESQNDQRDIDMNHDYGRQTLDLNGPIDDPALVQRRALACMSDIGNDQSEADDVNLILDNMESKSFKGFCNSDIDNSESHADERMMFKTKSKKASFMDIML